MKRVKKFLRRRGRLAAGVHFAMMMAATGKTSPQVHAVKADALPLAVLQKKKSLNGLTSLADKAGQEAREVALIADNIWDMAAELSESKQPGQQSDIDPTLTTDQARLWLQAYNAGPYALLKYKGHVPYRETQNYSPRVLKYYKEDLSDTPYEPYIQQAATKYGLDPQMIRAIMKTESSFRNTTVSHAGARGLMQVMPVVWKDIKERYNFSWDYSSGVFEPEKNIEVACAYLAWLRYDFLPRHFAEFDQDPQVPASLVRDKAPPRKTPRILASAISPGEAAASVATASPAGAAKVADAVAGVARSVSERSNGKTPSPSSQREKPKVTVSKAALSPAGTSRKTASVDQKARVTKTIQPGKSVSSAGLAVPTSKITTARTKTVGVPRAAVNPAQVKVATPAVRTKRPGVSGAGQRRAHVVVPASRISKAPSVADAAKPNSLQAMHQKKS